MKWTMLPIGEAVNDPGFWRAAGFYIEDGSDRDPPFREVFLMLSIEVLERLPQFMPGLSSVAKKFFAQLVQLTRGARGPDKA